MPTQPVIYMERPSAQQQLALSSLSARVGSVTGATASNMRVAALPLGFDGRKLRPWQNLATLYTFLAFGIAKDGVFSSVLRSPQDFQIFRSVIRTIAVFVMDFFRGQQFPTKDILHHQAMRRMRFSVDADMDIAIAERPCSAFSDDGGKRITVSPPTLPVAITPSSRFCNLIAAINRAFICHQSVYEGAA